MGTLTNYSPSQIVGLGILAVIAFIFYVYLGFVLPSKKLKDPATENKGFWKLWMVVMVSVPMIYILYLGIKGRMSGGNAASNMTGGTPPPGPTSPPAPNFQPSVVAGAAPAIIPALTPLPPATAGGVPINAGNRTKY
jgi:hypothetical protein